MTLVNMRDPSRCRRCDTFSARICEACAGEGALETASDIESAQLHLKESSLLPIQGRAMCDYYALVEIVARAIASTRRGRDSEVRVLRSSLEHIQDQASKYVACGHDGTKALAQIAEAALKPIDGSLAGQPKGGPSG